MLAALQNMLENMQIAKSASETARAAISRTALNQAIQQYGDLMGQQRALMDKTLRQSQGNGDPKDGGAQGLAKQQDECARSSTRRCRNWASAAKPWARPARRWNRRRNR